MSRKFDITPEQVSFLRDQYGRTTLKSLAERVGCNIDTLKRLLVRHSIARFPGAKFVPSRSSQETFWSRPCMRCRCTEPRPRNQYLCERCSSDVSDLNF